MTRLQGINPAVDFPHGRHGALYPAVQRALALRAEDRPATVADFRRWLTADARDAQRDGVSTAPDTQPPSSRPAATLIPADLSADPLAYRYCSKGQSFWIIGLAIFYYLYLFGILLSSFLDYGGGGEGLGGLDHRSVFLEVFITL